VSCANFVSLAGASFVGRYVRCMPRKPRLDVEGALHHVYDRGNRRQVICEDRFDFQLFLSLVELAARRFEWLVHAYCVLPNHYHLLIETPKAGLSRGMQLVNGRYAQAFNGGRRLDGHLFQGRFGSKLVEDEPHAIWVNRYIARNPVEAGLVENPADWGWSSYGALRRGCLPVWVAHDAALRLFGERESAAVEYERLILDPVGPDPPGHVQGLTPDPAYRDVWPVDREPRPTGPRSRRRTSRPRRFALRSAGP
jgi:REP element-mobilizing transposase RayT